MTSSKKRVLGLLLSLPLFVTSCNPSSIPLIDKLIKSGESALPSSEVTLTYWGLFESEGVMRPLFDEYEKNNPNVHINYEPKDFSDLKGYKDTVYLRLKNNTAPDIIRLHSSWVAEFFPYLSPAPRSLINKEIYAQNFYPAAVDTCVSSSGDVYAVPLMFEALVVFYNQDAMAEKGISRLPRTWDDFRELSIALTKRDEDGSMVTAGAALGISKNVAHASDILGLMFSQSNIRIPDDLDSDEAVNILNYYTSFYREDKVWDYWLPYSPIAFSEGKVAIMFAPTWQSFSILEESSDISVGIAAVPQIPVWGTPEITDINWASFWVEGVSKNSKNPDTAWDFLNFLSQKEQRDRLFEKGSRIRPFGTAFGLTELSETLRNNNYITNVVLGAPYAKTGIITDRVGNDAYAGAINQAIEDVANGKSAKQALSEAKAKIREAQKASGQ